MSMTDQCNAIHKKANQMRGALWSLVLAATAAYLVRSFGNGAPWWVYALFFAPSVFGFGQALTDEPTARKAKTSDDCGETPISARNAAIGDFDQGAVAWEVSGLPKD